MPLRQKTASYGEVLQKFVKLKFFKTVIKNPTYPRHVSVIESSMKAIRKNRPARNRNVGLFSRNENLPFDRSTISTDLPALFLMYSTFETVQVELQNQNCTMDLRLLSAGAFRSSSGSKCERQGSPFSKSNSEVALTGLVGRWRSRTFTKQNPNCLACPVTLHREHSLGLCHAVDVSMLRSSWKVE